MGSKHVALKVIVSSEGSLKRLSLTVAFLARPWGLRLQISHNPPVIITLIFYAPNHANTTESEWFMMAVRSDNDTDSICDPRVSGGQFSLSLSRGQLRQ